MPAVPQHDLLHVTDPEPVYVHKSGADLFSPLHGFRVQLHGLAILDDRDVRLIQSGLARQLGVK